VPGRPPKALHGSRPGQKTHGRLRYGRTRCAPPARAARGVDPDEWAVAELVRGRDVHFAARRDGQVVHGCFWKAAGLDAEAAQAQAGGVESHHAERRLAAAAVIAALVGAQLAAPANCPRGPPDLPARG